MAEPGSQHALRVEAFAAAERMKRLRALDDLLEPHKRESVRERSFTKTLISVLSTLDQVEDHAVEPRPDSLATIETIANRIASGVMWDENVARREAAAGGREVSEIVRLLAMLRLKYLPSARQRRTKQIKFPGMHQQSPEAARLITSLLQRIGTTYDGARRSLENGNSPIEATDSDSPFGAELQPVDLLRADASARERRTVPSAECGLVPLANPSRSLSSISWRRRNDAMPFPIECDRLGQCLADVEAAIGYVAMASESVDRASSMARNSQRLALLNAGQQAQTAIVAAQDAIPGVATCINPLVNGCGPAWTSGLKQTLANMGGMLRREGAGTAMLQSDAWHHCLNELHEKRLFLANADYSAIRPQTKPASHSPPPTEDTDPRLWADPTWFALNAACDAMTDHPEYLYDKTPEAPEGLNMNEVNRLAREVGMTTGAVIEAPVEKNDVRRWLEFHHPTLPRTVSLCVYDRTAVTVEPQSKVKRAFENLHAWRDLRREQLLSGPMVSKERSSLIALAEQVEALEDRIGRDPAFDLIVTAGRLLERGKECDFLASAEHAILRATIEAARDGETSWQASIRPSERAGGKVSPPASWHLFIRFAALTVEDAKNLGQATENGDAWLRAGLPVLARMLRSASEIQRPAGLPSSGIGRSSAQHTNEADSSGATLILNAGSHTATIRNRETFDLTPAQSKFLQILIEAESGIVTRKRWPLEIRKARPDKIKGSLPEALRGLVLGTSGPRGGFRLTVSGCVVGRNSGAMGSQPSEAA